MSLEPVDVLIIGAGASGSAIAWSLVETRMKILCLEQGDWVNPLHYPSTGRDWEARSFKDFSINPNRRKLNADYPVNDKNSPISVANYNAVGGSSILYAAHYPRFHPSDFRVRSLDGVADDWPIDYEALAPFYDENDRMVGVSGLAGDTAYPPKESQMPPVPLGLSGATLAQGFNSMGWHWWPSDSTVATKQYDGRDQCINLGACVAGCAQGAKASTDITYWPHAIRAGVELRTRCRVREIIVRTDGMAGGAVYFDKRGEEQRITAEVVILACNGVGTPRLLLNSKSQLFPDGLANSSGLVGKNLMLHPYSAIFARFNAETDGARGPGNCIWSQEFYETDPSRNFVRGFTFEIARGMGPALTVARGMADGRIAWGANHHLSARKAINRITGMVGICEDLPDENNQVTLDPHLKDPDGVPAPKLHYRISENTKHMLEFSLARGTEILEAAGGKDIQTVAPIPDGGWHLMGTARMGKDQKKSVVNEWGRCHDVKNLFIVDGSIFVTSAGVNPTRTIQALALYIADSMKRRLTTLFD